MTGSLNAKLLLILVCAVTVSGVLGAVRQGYLETRRLEAHYDRRLLQVSQRYEQRLLEELQRRETLVTAVVRHLEERFVADADDGDLPAPVSALARHWDSLLREEFRALTLVTPSGHTRLWPESGGGEMNSLPPDLPATGYSARWTPVYRDALNNQSMLALTTPLFLQNEHVGTLIAELSVGTLTNTLERLDIGGGTFSVVLKDSRGRAILPVSHSSEAVTASGVQWLEQQISQGQPSDAGIHKEYYRRLEPVGWYLGVAYPKALIDRRFRDTMTEVYWNIMLLTALIAGVLYLALRLFVSHRVIRLAREIVNLDGEDWDARVTVAGDDEISQVAESVNQLLRRIQMLFEGVNENVRQLDRAGLETKKLVSVIDNTPSLVVILDGAWQPEYANTTFWRASGYNPGDRLSVAQALLLPDSSDTGVSVAEIQQALQEAKNDSSGAAARGPHWRAEYQARRANGETIWLMQSISAVRSDMDGSEYYICVAQDITHLKDNQRRVEQLAYYDHLTGLHNRLVFKEQLRIAIHSCLRDRQRMALLYLDLDHFKKVNDSLGHEAGDRLLIEVSRRLRECLREEDLVARLGGDEFAILLQRIGNPQYAFIVADKIIKAVNRPILLSGQEVVVGASVGITMAPDDGETVELLMKNADMAMYQAKEKGRNMFQFYTQDMNFAVEYRITLERELRRALKKQEFVLHFQPIVDLRSGDTVAVEALIRWNHPVRGMVPPVEFIPMAEESGLIVGIGRWVMQAACQQAKAIQKAIPVPVTMCVNISARQLNNEHFIDQCQQALRDARLEPSLLTLEVTESTLMTHQADAFKRLSRLRAMGVGLAIDDFGTGYSSLSHLKRLPVSSLKVDRSFVQDLPQDEEDRAITTLIVAMANSLNYDVVVEGVETREQLQFLTRCGCDYAQGFYFSRPLPADRLMQKLFDEHSKVP